MPYADSGGLRLFYTETGAGPAVLWHTGEEDWWALGQAAASAMPHGQAVALNGLGHLQAFWRTDLALPPIRRFLATLGAAAGA